MCREDPEVSARRDLSRAGLTFRMADANSNGMLEHGPTLYRLKSSGQEEHEWHSAAFRLVACAGLGSCGSCRSSLSLPSLKSCGRGLTDLALLAFIAVIQKVTRSAGNLDTVIAVALEARSANQRTNPRRLELDRIERIGARGLGIELGAGALIEQLKRAPRRRIPLPTGRSREAADPAQFGLHRFCQLGWRRWRRGSLWIGERCHFCVRVCLRLLRLPCC